MVSKKYTVLIALLLTFGVTAFAQTSGWDWKDSSVVPVKSITQYNEFKQNKNPFPPKPRNAWEVGLSLGPSYLEGDVNSKLGIGGSLTFRKAITNALSIRFGYFGSFNYGNGGLYNQNSPLGAAGYYGAIPNLTLGYTAPNYRNKTHMVGVDLISSLNTFSNYRGDPTVNVYILGGLNLLASSVKVNDPTSGSSVWYYCNNYTTKGMLGLSKLGGHEMWLLTGSVGAGFAYKVNNKYNIGFEERVTAPFQRFGFLDGFDAGSNDFYLYSGFKINYNLF